MKSKINWTNTLFLIFIPIIGIVGTILLAVKGQVAWPTWVMTVFFAITTGLSITGGYHRLFAHKSYQATWPVRLFFVLFGAAAFEGSVLEWSTDHRNHHRYTDTDNDPYDIKKGFWFAHIGWLFVLDTSKRDFGNVEDLAADPLIRWQHRFFVPISLFMGLGLPMLLGALWGNLWAGLIVGGALRATFSHHTTFFINSICHLWGKRTFSTQQSARDNWVTAVLTFGEGYHNFHHQFPLDYRNGVRLYHFDPTKWIIKLLEMVGLASDLKRVSDERILRYRLQADEQRILTTWQHQADTVMQYISVKVKPLREAILQLLRRIEELEQEYHALKMHQKVEHYKQRLQEHRQTLKAARRELRIYLMQWTTVIDPRIKRLSN